MSQAAEGAAGAPPDDDLGPALYRATGLAERPAGGRRAAQVTPEWLAELVEAYRDTPAASSGKPVEIPAEVPPDPRFAGARDARFAGLVEPLLARARCRLVEQLATLPGRERLPFDPVELLAWLYPSLARRLDRMLTRTMVLELQQARIRGSLPGADPIERFDAFCARLRRPDERRRLLQAYPVLGRLLATVALDWVQAGARFAARLAADWPALAATFGRSGRLGPVTDLVTELGDPHRGGQTGLALTFAGEVRLVYKPRPVTVDRNVQQLLDWLVARGLSCPVRLPRVIDRGNYGWVEFVAPRPCADRAGLHRFYRRQGVLLAVLYLLRASDLHAENVIAVGEHPMLVDLEATCQPELALGGDRPAAEEAAVAEATRSVLRVGLLPIQSWQTAAGASADLSGLGPSSGQLSPLALPVVVDGGTDRMRIQLRRQPLAATANQPSDPGSPVRVLDYVDDIVAGFSQTYELCQRHRRELLAADGVLAAFAGNQVRVIVRATAEYALLRSTGLHPEVLADGLDTDGHFDRLWQGVSRRPGLAALVEHERADLWRQDIPVFTARTDESVLRASTGVPIPGLVRKTGLAAVREAAARLGPDDLTRQRWLIRASVAAATMNLRAIEPTSYPLPPIGGPADRDRLIAAADEIGRHLGGLAYRAPDSVEWLGVVSARGERWSLGPLGPDLCTGLTGLALFFGALASVTDQPEHTVLARAALRTARAQVERGALPRVGGCAGIGGIIYALTQLSTWWEDGELLDHAVSLVRAAGEWATTDTQFDFAAGSAGSIVALQALHAVRPGGAVRDAVRACGDRLVRQARPAGPGVAWLPQPMQDAGVAQVPIAGLAHGTAGIAWPLLVAAALCGEQRYHDTALAALAYERSLFLPTAGTWRDLRAEHGDAFTISAWCHGAAGVGLARIRTLPYHCDDLTRAEVAAAVDHTLQIGFGTNHSLCHGDLGSLELLTLAAEALATPRWQDQAQRLAGAVLDSIDEQGWLSGAPHGVETPGLLIGLAGTGYGLLRLASPQQVPSVLTLGPPSTGTASHAATGGLSDGAHQRP